MSHAARAILLFGAVLAAPAAEAGTLSIDDFADGDLQARPGLAWMVIADDVLGGPATGSLAVRKDGQEEVMVVTGKVGTPDQLPVSFVGAWTAVGDGTARDLSAYTGVRLRVRVVDGAFQLGLRRASATVNFVAPLESTAEWREIDVPFSQLRPQQPGIGVEWSATDITWIGVSASGTTPGPVHLELDRIAFYGGPDAEAAPPAAVPAGAPVARARLVDPAPLAGLEWNVVVEDPAGDSLRPDLPDARSLAWAAGDDGRIWFRARLAGPPPERWMGLNVALDEDGDPTNGMAWWGTNSAFKFDRLVTAYLTRAEGYWMGALGIAGADDVARGVMNDGTVAGVVATIDRSDGAFLVGVPRDALPADRAVRLIATVGSSMINNDDLPDEGAVEWRLPARGGS